jgi:hypothetical protein
VRRQRGRRSGRSPVAAGDADGRTALAAILQWIQTGARPEDPEALLRSLRALLEEYPSKMRLATYALSIEQAGVIAQSIKALRQLIQKIVETSPYASHRTRIRMAGVLGDAIASGMEGLRGLAGLSVTPERLLAALMERGGAAMAGGTEDPLRGAKPEEREHIRQKWTEIAAQVLAEAEGKEKGQPPS